MIDLKTIEAILGKSDAYFCKYGKFVGGISDSVNGAIKNVLPDGPSCATNIRVVSLRKKNVRKIMEDDVSDFVSEVEDKLTEYDGFSKTSEHNLSNLIINAIDCCFEETDERSYEEVCYLDLKKEIVAEILKQNCSA